MRTALAVVLAVGIACGAVACGDDDETDETAPAVTAQPTETAATEAAPRPETETSETETGDTDTAEADGGGAAAPDGQSSPENQPGGAGDEVPASSQALITGRGGRLHPTVVRVPPFIAIRVELDSADGIEYELEGGGRDVKAGGEIRSASTTYQGLRPGKRLVLSGPQGKVTIEATAEPGP
jgi:hypothetical protein